MPAAESTGSTILIIEASTIDREGMAVVLRRRGYAPITATNGGAALDLLDGGAWPDLILLDMLKSAADGRQFLTRVGAGRVKQVPVVAMIGEDQTAEWTAEHRCAGVLSKPFGEPELVAEIGRAIATR